MYKAAKYIQQVDPAASSPWEVIFTYAGFHALGCTGSATGSTSITGALVPPS